jgi:ubiquinone/menaquinone biosynthesis C-methylase UbiE
MPGKISKASANVLWKWWYPFVTRLSNRTRVHFLNYGYVDDSPGWAAPALKEEDEADRPCIQLYHRVAGGVDLRGLDVLEVSCGHGGGAAYVAGYLQPNLVQAVDRNARGIELCRRRHQIRRLIFYRGNALALQSPDERFDAVINVEASHCYPDVSRFLAEVQRVLRPGGHFLYADFRESGAPRVALEQQIANCGLETISCADISSKVIRGMQANTPKYLDLIQRLVPRVLRKHAMRFAGVEGSTMYRELVSGETVYLCYHLRKPARL